MSCVHLQYLLSYEYYENASHATRCTYTFANEHVSPLEVQTTPYVYIVVKFNICPRKSLADSISGVSTLWALLYANFTQIGA